MYVTPDLYNSTLCFIFKFVYFSGKGLESNISKEVLPLNQPFSPLSSPLKKKKKKKTISHLNYFMDHHFSTKEQKLENLHVMKKTKKKLYLLSVQLCLVRCEKNPEPRFSRERIKKKKKSGHPPSPPKNKVQVWLFSWVKEKTNNVV